MGLLGAGGGSGQAALPAEGESGANVRSVINEGSSNN